MIGRKGWRRRGHIVSVPVAVTFFLLSFLTPTFSQQPDEKPSSQRGGEQGRHVPIFGNADEFAIASGIEYYEPWPGFNRLNRDISLQVARLALAAHLRQGWEFQFNGLAFRAHGDITAGSPIPVHVASNALALGGGPMARWNFLQSDRFRSFVDAEGDLIFSDRKFPAGGTIYNFFLHAGGGISLRVSDSYWVESAFRFAHISNGQCFCRANPAWNGGGLTLGLRRSFFREPRSSSNTLFGLLKKADESAWLTGVEYYKALPGSSPSSRSIDVRVVRINRAWHLPDRLEFQLGGMFETTKAVAGIGPALRWNLIENGRWRTFVDGGGEVVQTGSPAYIIPTGGVAYNFLLRGGGGASFRLGQSYWLEGGFRWVHVSSGVGPGANNLLSWSGQGPSLTLRHTFR